MLWKWCSIVYHHSSLTIAMMSGDSYDYVTVSQVCQTVGVPGSSLVNLQGGLIKVVMMEMVEMAMVLIMFYITHV